MLNSLIFLTIFLVLEYVDSSKRTLVGNLGLALFLTLSGVYQPWAIKYAYFKFLQNLKILLYLDILGTGKCLTGSCSVKWEL